MKLLIADDHTLFREALVQYIERADPLAKVVTVKDFYEAQKTLEQEADYDLVLLDMVMPGMNGLAGFAAIKAAYPGLPLALMSGIAEEDDVRRAFELGAIGYFPKTLSGKSLLQGIKHVLSGRPFVPQDKTRAGIMPSHYTDESRRQLIKRLEDLNLTPREVEVLRYLAGGASNKEIARALGLQIVTIKLHVRGVCRKLGTQNRTQAALLAKEFGVKPLTAIQ